MNPANITIFPLPPHDFGGIFVSSHKTRPRIMSHRILLVDDEPDIIEFVRYNLLKEGYEVFTAADGAEALRVAAECRPHLILLDRMMPVMDGAETCRAIRRDPALRGTIVVFLSALGEEEQQLTGFGVGADDYLTKPIRMKLLVSRLRAILKRVNETDGGTPPTGISIDRERYTVRYPARDRLCRADGCRPTTYITPCYRKRCSPCR